MITTGKSWEWTGFADYMVARIVVCCKGSLFVSSVPFEHFETEIMKGNWSLTQCANHMHLMSANDIILAGGCYRFLCPGEGVAIPAGHIGFQAAAGLVGNQLQLPQGANVEEGSVFVVPCKRLCKYVGD